MLISIGLIFSIIIPIAAFILVESKIKLAGFPRLVVSVVSIYPLTAFILDGLLNHLTNSQVAGLVIVITISLFCAGVNAFKAFIPSRNL